MAGYAGTSDAELANTDIADLNLLCASGLPGTERLQISSVRGVLDLMAQAVRRETDRHFYKFRKSPGEYDNSEAVYRIMMLVTVLQQDFGVRYNMERMEKEDYSHPEDLFIHGMINSDNGGTCVSMPVLCAAIGRRLGYPIKLVLAKAHVFCRWDDGRSQFNFEGTSRGFVSESDEHYRKWPYPISDGEVQRGEYLKSLSPREELSVFLSARGHCLLAHHRRSEAYAAYLQAYELSSRRPENLSYLYLAVREQADPGAIARDAELRRRRDEERFANIQRLNEQNRAVTNSHWQREVERINAMNRHNQLPFNPYPLGHGSIMPDPVAGTAIYDPIYNPFPNP